MLRVKYAIIDISYFYVTYFIDADTIEQVTSSRINNNDFEVLKLIGQGGFGKVQLVNYYDFRI